MRQLRAAADDGPAVELILVAEIAPLLQPIITLRAGKPRQGFRLAKKAADKITFIVRQRHLKAPRSIHRNWFGIEHEPTSFCFHMSAMRLQNAKPGTRHYRQRNDAALGFFLRKP